MKKSIVGYVIKSREDEDEDWMISTRSYTMTVTQDGQEHPNKKLHNDIYEEFPVGLLPVDFDSGMGTQETRVELFQDKKEALLVCKYLSEVYPFCHKPFPVYA